MNAIEIILAIVVPLCLLVLMFALAAVAGEADESLEAQRDEYEPSYDWHDFIDWRWPT